MGGAETVSIEVTGNADHRGTFLDAREARVPTGKLARDNRVTALDAFLLAKE